nr:immunoglobulin heavy chain junction region [Macaca mulatta]MOW80046.1 immunoglobulin heavy chain junction region [Macaca mulatta]
CARQGYCTGNGCNGFDVW